MTFVSCPMHPLSKSVNFRDLDARQNRKRFCHFPGNFPDVMIFGVGSDGIFGESHENVLRGHVCQCGLVLRRFSISLAPVQNGERKI